MATRRSRGTFLAVLWVLALVLAAVMWWAYGPTHKLGFRSGFPYMPRYGAMTWWFFFVIPLIGYTWGWFNDLHDDGIRERTYDAVPPRDDVARRR